MVFCNKNKYTLSYKVENVTILILVDGFLQYHNVDAKNPAELSHNPYFSRWFSAISYSELKEMEVNVTILILVDGFLQFKSLMDFLSV